MRRNSAIKYSALKMGLIIVVIVTFAVISLSAAFFQFYRPSSGSDIPPWLAADTNADGSIKTPGNAGDEIQAAAPKQLAGEYELIEGSYNFLIVGYDKVAMLTDSIMIVNFNVTTGKIAILQIPRDTYIDSTYCTSKHINGVYRQYLVRNSSEKDVAMNALNYLKKTLEENLCIKIQNSAVIELEGFPKIIDALGGVEVDVPFDMDYEDPLQDLYIHLKAGVHNLNGEQSEWFVRFRDSYVNADIGRLDAQKIFMSSLMKQVKSLDFNIPKVIGEVLSYATTDMSLIDCIYFAKEAMGIDLEDVTMVTLPTIPHESSFIVMNREAAREIINNYMNVYNIEITNAVFDRKLIFTDENNSEINSLYTTPANLLPGMAYLSEYNAKEATDGSIYIPRKKSK